MFPLESEAVFRLYERLLLLPVTDTLFLRFFAILVTPVNFFEIVRFAVFRFFEPVFERLLFSLARRILLTNAIFSAALIFFRFFAIKPFLFAAIFL